MYNYIRTVPLEAGSHGDQRGHERTRLIQPYVLPGHACGNAISSAMGCREAENINELANCVVALQGANGKMKHQLSPDDAYPVGAARQCDVLQAIWWVIGLGQQFGIFCCFSELQCLSVALLVVFQISACSVAGRICVNLQSWQIWETMSESLHFFPHYVTHNPWVFLHTCQSAGGALCIQKLCRGR